MKTVDQKTLDTWIARIEAVQPDAKPEWGKMSSELMLAHLRRSFEITLGEVDIKPVKMNPVGKFLLKVLVFDGPIPFPKGKAEAPPEFIPECGTFDEEQAAAIAYTKKFAAAVEENPKAEYMNALFGMQPLTWWSRLHGKHMDHHLRQFGV